MAIWAQIGDSRVTSIPPDGRTSVNMFSSFRFSNQSLPEGTVIKFIIGKGELPFEDSAEEVEVKKRWTEEEIVTALSPIQGVQLRSDSGAVGFQVESRIQKYVVRDKDDNLAVESVALASIVPIDDVLKDEITVIAYSNFDKSGTIKRLEPQQAKLTVSSDEGVFLGVVERYDPSSDEWEQVASMNVGRAGPFCEAVGGKVYAIGGFKGNFTDVAERYDPSTNKWAKVSPLPIARGYGCAAAYGGKIYVIGGYNFDVGRASSLVHRYDPVMDSWAQMASLPLPVSHATCEVVGASIYLLFGATRFQTKSGDKENVEQFNFGVFKYDISLDSWSVEDVDISPVTTAATMLLQEAATAGQTFLRVPGNGAFPPYGALTVNRSGGNAESLMFSLYDAANGILRLSSPLSNSHSSGETIINVSLPQNRIAPNSVLVGSSITTCNGYSFLGFGSNAGGRSNASLIRGSIIDYDTSTKQISTSATTPGLPRYAAADAVINVGGVDRLYITGGSATKSDYLNELEFLDTFLTSFVGPSGISEMLFVRNSLGAAVDAGLLYAIGGRGSGHAPGWLRMTAKASPSKVRANGRETSGVSVTAVDASGDPPPDGIKFKARGILYVVPTDEEKPAETQPATPAAPDIGPPPQKASILPILFSSPEMTLQNGVAGSIMLGRSEDPIREVENLFQFTRNGEEVPNEEALKTALTEDLRHKSTRVGESRNLYSVAIEITVDDDFYFGQTDTDSAIKGHPTSDLSSFGNGFTFNTTSAQQEPSATVDFYSDITSIPDVELLTEEPVDASDAKDILDDIGEETPFGASPHFDAMLRGIRARIIDPLLPQPSNLIVSTSDNDESFSSNSPDDVVEEANAVDGPRHFPIFPTSFIVTDPISLAARRARTDVADLEFIAFETGGNSFSVVDASYVDFVIERIKTSAQSSMGSGVILATKDIDGSITSITYVVEGVPGNAGAVPNAASNLAEMRLFLTDDGYNFEELGTIIGPNITFTFSTPRRATQARYEIILRSKTFDSPILKSVTIGYVKDGIQYLFTFPQQISGQVAEIASTANHRLPSGGDIEFGIAHGSSVMFERDYANISQPAPSERGTTTVVNRSFDTFIGEKSTRDALETDDQLVYRSKSGSWPQEAIARVFVNEQEVLPAHFLAIPEEGVIAFKKRLSTGDKVGIEVQLPTDFRVGLKIRNPSLSPGKIDSFAFMYGVTQDEDGIRINRIPKAVNLFITPTPILPGGPIEANYTFSDPDGDEEEKATTEINWFRNGVVVPELKNLRSITSSDLVARRADAGRNGLIAKGQKWFFSVRPSDGRAFGPLSISHEVVVSNVAPTAKNEHLESSNKDDPKKFTTSDSISVKFDVVDTDLGDVDKDSIVTWFVNGIEVKSGASRSIEPTETDSNGSKLLRPGSVVRAEIVPSDGSDFGSLATTDSITVEGAPPVASNVSVLPTAPSSASKLRVTYQLTDPDKGTDQSSIAWFRNDLRVSELDNLKEVNPILTSPGQQWYAVVTPNNGFASGTAVKSNVVVIQF